MSCTQSSGRRENWVKLSKASSLSFALRSVINRCDECGKLGHCSGNIVQFHRALFVAVESNSDVQRKYLMNNVRRKIVRVLLYYQFMGAIHILQICIFCSTLFEESLKVTAPSFKAKCICTIH